MGSGRSTVFAIGSAGGHFDLLAKLSPALGDRPCMWITTPGARARALVEAGQTVHTLTEFERGPRAIARSLVEAFKTVRLHRPEVVLTTGAGLCVPFVLLSRLLGARIIFVETMARVDTPSQSGRLLSRLAEVVVVQWPEMRAVYPKARLCRPVLVESVDRLEPAGDRSGTFVAVGTHNQAFDRLLELVDRAAASGVLPSPVWVQSGVSEFRSERFEQRRWMTPAEIDERASSAAYVVCHAGSGIIAASLRGMRRPLVLARMHAQGEHVDDHQVQIVNKLGELDMVVPLPADGEITEEHLRSTDRPWSAQRTRGIPSAVDVVREALSQVEGPR